MEKEFYKISFELTMTLKKSGSLEFGFEFDGERINSVNVDYLNPEHTS
jgi:hypothetical protein